MEYVLVYSLEAIQGSQYVTYNSTDLLSFYIDNLISGENDLSDNYKKDFPSDLSDYRDFYNRISLGNICEEYRNKTSTELIDRPMISSFADCTVLKDTTLKKG